MAAYLVINARITDFASFKAYAEQAARLLQQFGGEYVVRGGEQQLLEGEDASVRVVISRFADREAALAFWNSPQYQQIKTLRAGTGTFDVRLVEEI